MQSMSFARYVIFLIGAFSVVTYAQSYTLPDPGLTPESPLYFLDLWDERMRLFFTRSDETRLKRYTAIVEERLAETHKLAGRGIAATQKSLEEYHAHIPLLFGVAERLGNKIIISDALRMITDHMAVLDHVSERTDYDKKRFVLIAKKFIIDQQLQTLSFFAKAFPEDALRIFVDAFQRRMDRIREVAIDKENNEEALQEYAAYLSEVDSILHEWKTDLVDSVPPAVFMEIAVRGHEETLLGPVRERIPPTLDQELFLLVNKVRELSGRELLTVLPPRKVEEIEPTPQPVLSPMEGEPTPTTTPTPSPQPSPTPKPSPKPQPQPTPTPAPTPPPAPTVSLSANPSTISQGSSSMLSWSSANATSCTASSGWSGTKTTSGSVSITPSVTTAYSLSCTGSGGSASRSVTVTVSESLPPPPPPPLAF